MKTLLFFLTISLGLSSFCLAQTVRFINPPTLSKNLNYSHVAVVTGGKTIYLSGQVAQDKAGNLVGKGDFKAQATQTLENVRLALEAAGASVQHIVKINTYMINMDDLQAYREIRRQFLADLAAPPISTTVQVARLFQDGCLLEVEVVAVIP